MKKLISPMIILITIMTIQLNGSCSYGDKKTDENVLKAYELRMNGQVDQAKSLLEATLKEDSTNAMAHFEMARVLHYMLTGGGGSSMEDIVASASKAVKYDPDNVTYSYYKAISTFLNGYMAMQMQQGDVKPYVDEACLQFENVLKLKPDYYEAMLYLVEIKGMLPPDMGGDSLKAQKYADKLAASDTYYGTMAKISMAPEGTNALMVWEDLLATDEINPQFLAEVGKAYLYQDDPASAEKYFNKAIEADPSNSILTLNLARYHMYKVMRDRELASTELPIATSFVEKYLESKPEPIVPLKAYAYGMLSNFERFNGNQEAAEKMAEKAKSLDPYFSRASGVPNALLFSPPDKICHQYFSFFSPF